MIEEIFIKRQPECILPKSFVEGRFIPSFHPESIDYAQWWQEQIRRCREGWSDGGFYVTPEYYYHLNFKKINMLDEKDQPIIDHPYFSYEDQELFQDIETANNQGKGIILITGRGFGKSFGVSSVAECRFVFRPVYEVIVSASIRKYVDQLWYKIKLGLNALPDDIRPSLLVDKQDEMESGYEVVEDGKKKIKGYRSKMLKYIYDNDPGLTRGTRPGIHLFEEVGAWSGAAKLIDCYKATEASWWRGKKFTCLPLLIGTGGEMKSGGSEDAKKMFFNPEAYNLMAFDYSEEGSPHPIKIGKFFPAYMKFGGTYELSGESRIEESKPFLIERRERKKDDIEMYEQETAEYPFTPYEAFAIIGQSPFKKHIIKARINEIERDPDIKNEVVRGNLEFIRIGSRVTGVKWTEDKDGIFEVLRKEFPRIDEATGKAYENLYVSGCDSFDAVLEEAKDSQSKGSIKIFKRFWKASETGRIFVASLVQRTDDAEEFYWNTVKLNMWYNCKMLYEHTKIGIARHYITNKLANYLYPKPDLQKAGVIKDSRTTNRFGLTMPEVVKVHGIVRYSKYIDEYNQSMYFTSQLKDAHDFIFGSPKFDETMSAALCIIADEDMYNLEVEEAVKESIKFPVYRRDHEGKLVFA